MWILETSVTKNKVLSDEQLIDIIRSNCRRGAFMIYRQYAQALRLTISRILRNDVLTEDTLQMTFAKIWRCVHLYNPKKGSFLPGC